MPPQARVVPRLDARAGRSAALADLRRHLSSAGPAYLEGAIENPRLGEVELLLLLRNRRAPGALLEGLVGDRRWCRSPLVLRTLALHPATPPSAAQRVLEGLGWRDLAEVAGGPHTHPRVRRRAEQLIELRLQAMALGERVALARRAGRGIFTALLQTGEAPVLASLLGNPLLTEADALGIARTAVTPPDVLARLSEHPRWGERLSIRLALLVHPRLPVAAALHLLGRLAPKNLRALTRDVKVPQIVRVAAQRRLGSLDDARTSVPRA